MDVSMGSVVLSAIVAALWIGTADKAWQLWRAPEDLALRAVTACLACVAAMFSLSLPPVRAVLDQADTGLRVLAVNLGTMTTAYFLLAFFTYSVHGPAEMAGFARQSRWTPRPWKWPLSLVMRDDVRGPPGAVVITTRASGDDVPRSVTTKRRTLAYRAVKP